MDITGVELRRIAMPLVAPFRTSFGTETARDVLLVRVVTPDAEGWGECVAMSEPVYSSEYVDGAAEVIRRFLAPTLMAARDVTAERVASRLAPVRGHRMAKAALETAVLDAQLRARGESFGAFLGAERDRVPAGVSVGIMDSIPELLDAVDGYLAEGYLRIKLKIEPDWDVVPVRAVRERFGDILLQVDANAAYTLADAATLARLDDFDLLLIEQPLAEDDIRQHAELARLIRTPVCLDESIGSVEAAADAIALRAARVINIKPGRVGGYLEARRIHDLCRANGIPVWCGGMLETGIGRAANVALAALPGFTLPGDTSASSRYFARDVTSPFVLEDGHLRVPEGAGIGVDPLPDALAEFTTSSEYLAAV
ncbi:o-succinylbenzoate synthase [Micromonospora sp. CPCC 206061]|uniref:o-succinylbenzoate synthase n=1 Tax=Micromonospora sp. CPCC 206061 TaxID=3122410 RepID=UPI002FF01704